MAFNRRTFTISILGILGGCLVGGLIAGLVYVFVIDKNKKEVILENVADKESYIRERTFSLKFNTSLYTDPSTGNRVKTSLYGTSWIFNKALNKEVYYLATNIHVISNAVSLQHDQTNRYQIADYIESVELGYPNNPKVVSQTDDLSSEMFNTRAKFPKIAYTSSFVETTPTYPIPIQISANTNFYSYAMTDLAILEFDFSSTTDNFKNFLKYYNLNPTKFFSPQLGSNNYSQQNYFIGGYPYLKPDPNQSPPFGTWGFDNSINEKVGIISGTIISSVSDFPFLYPSGVAFPNDITTNQAADQLRYFQNISNQITITNIDLTGGSSGSMVINDNNEVMGIYWGAYISGDGKLIRGAFDILNTASYSTLFPNNVIGSRYNAYNRVEEANSIINTLPPF
ncbi:MAG: hypothetical protein RSE95_01800 [Malacoplasma sp.]